MSCNCITYQCLSVDHNPCSNGVQLPINADETGNWSVLIEFNGTWIRLSLEVTEGEPIVIPNVLNERYTHTIRLLNSNKELFNGTCYKLMTGQGTNGDLIPLPQGGNDDGNNACKETYRMDFITAGTDTLYTFSPLIGAELLDVTLETINLDIDTQLAFNANLGTINFLTPVSDGQKGFILYKK